MSNRTIDPITITNWLRLMVDRLNTAGIAGLSWSHVAGSTVITNGEHRLSFPSDTEAMAFVAGIAWSHGFTGLAITATEYLRGLK